MVRRLVVFLLTFLLGLAVSVRAEAEDVLVIGDSHAAGDFGRGLVNTLRENPGNRVAVAAVCGSSPGHFLGRAFKPRICSFNLGYGDANLEAPSARRKGAVPSLDSLLKSRKPATVVVAHGTNQYPIKKGFDYKRGVPGTPLGDKRIAAAVESARADVAATMDKIRASGARCRWVGPPSQREWIYSEKLQDDFERMYREEGEKRGCPFVSSRGGVTNAEDTKKDKAMGIHYPGRAGLEWGRAIGLKLGGGVPGGAGGGGPKPSVGGGAG